MSAIDNTVGCGFGADELLPPLAGGGDGPLESLPAALVHARACDACARALAQRAVLAEELRALPRLAAPAGPGAALSAKAILEQLDEPALDRRLAFEEPVIRRLLRGLERLRAPLRRLPRLPGSLEPAAASVTGPRRLLLRAVALAAAAALIAAVTLPLLTRTGRSGLAAETAALSDRAPIPAPRIVYVDPGSEDAARIRPLLVPPSPRRGGP